jgi:hypothetical protein
MRSDIEPPSYRAWMDAVLGRIAKDLGLPWPANYAITRAPDIDPVRERMGRSDLQIEVDEAWCRATGWCTIIDMPTMTVIGWMCPGRPIQWTGKRHE